MVILRMLTLLFCFTAIPISSAEEGNVLIYTDPVQISTEISPYETISENTPINGTLSITRKGNLKVDTESFRIGSDPLQVKFVKEVTISPNDNLVISIYQFELKGKKNGNYSLPPISGKVGGKAYQAPSLNIVIGN